MTQLTVGELKKVLQEYPDNAIVYMEPSNAHMKGKYSTKFSQKAECTYPCDNRGEKALMIVGSVR